MKILFAEVSENSEMLLKKQAPMVILTAAVIVTGAVLIWAIHQSYKSNHLQRIIHEKSRQISKLRASENSSDDSASMVAKIRTLDKDSNWTEFNQNYEAQLENVESEINLIAAEDDKESAEQTLEAREKLAETERKIFALASAGEKEKALSLIGSEEYTNQKKDYENKLNSFLETAAQTQSVLEETVNTDARLFLAAEIVLVVLFVWSWWAVIKRLRNSRKVLLAQIDENKKTEKELQENIALLSSVFEATEDGILIIDSKGSIVAYNQNFLKIWNIPTDIAERKSNREALKFASAQLANAEDFIKRTTQLDQEPETIGSDILIFKDGRIGERHSRPHFINGKVAGRVLSFRDVTVRKTADAALRESENKFRTLLESMNEGLSQVDTNQVIEFVNDRFCDMTGYTREELLGKSVVDIFMDEAGRKAVDDANEQRLRGISSQYEVRLKKKSGEIVWVIVGGAPIYNAQNEIIGSLGVFTDITERKFAEQKLLHDALHDGLTGLANRTLFINHLQNAIERSRRSNNLLYAVLFLDFDRFKVINDSLGHAEGDNLLKQIARRLENLLRGGDLLARLGGDEFTILLNELKDSQDAVTVAERIKQELNQPFLLGSQEIFMSASIGIALSNSGHHRAEDMLRDADIAMYRAKAHGKAQYQIFDAAMHVNARNKLQLETEMHQALQRGEFSLNYQPIVSIETRNLIGFEALVRWNHPERGMIPPGDFIAAAEENGLVVPLGRWILYESCRQIREWQKNFAWASALTVSVNLSCKQFQQNDLVEQVSAALISAQLDPRCLKLEITETHVMETSDKAVMMMNRLCAAGVEISLDDFGTGYSSLSYLHRLPVNYLKIDRSFVNRMIESRENREIVYTIVKLAQNLRMGVIAEGIETAEQFDQLKNIGCDFGQGYFISKPMTAETANEYLNKLTNVGFVAIDAPVISSELNM